MCWKRKSYNICKKSVRSWNRRDRTLHDKHQQKNSKLKLQINDEESNSSEQKESNKNSAYSKSSVQNNESENNSAEKLEHDKESSQKEQEKV